MNNNVNINLLSEKLNKIREELTGSHLIMEEDKRIELNTRVTNLLDQALKIKLDESMKESLGLAELDEKIRNYINSDPCTLEELNEVLSSLNEKIESIKTQELSHEQKVEKYKARLAEYKENLKKYHRNLNEYNKSDKVLYTSVKAEYSACRKEYDEIMALYRELNDKTLDRAAFPPRRVTIKSRDLTSNDLKALITQIKAYDTALGEYETTSADIYEQKTREYEEGKITYEEYTNSVSDIVKFYFALKETQKYLSNELEEVTNSYSDNENYNLATEEQLLEFQNELREYEKNLAIYARESKVLEEYRKEFEEGKMTEEEFHMAEEVLAELEGKLLATRKELMQKRKSIYNPSILPRKMKFKKILETRLSDPNLTEESRKECEAKLIEINKEIREFKSKCVIKEVKPRKKAHPRKKNGSNKFDMSEPTSFGYPGPKTSPDPKPDPTPIPVPPTPKENDELYDLYMILLGQYKEEYEKYLQEHERLEKYKNHYLQREVPYVEYGKYADYVITRDNYMKAKYDFLMVIYEKLISRGKDEAYANSSDEELQRLIDELNAKEILTDEEHQSVEKMTAEMNRRNKNKEIEKPQEPLTTEKIAKKDQIKVTFLNCGFGIENYDNILIEPGTVIHGPVIDPVPLNKKGQPKKITWKIFDCWIDENGNTVDLNQPMTRSITLSAKYKFDPKKALAYGAGVAVGAVAYLVDSAIPLQIPVVSSLGATGLGMVARGYHKNLTNIVQANQAAAARITAVDEIPEGLKAEIAEAKKRGYQSTFLKTAATACGISALAHGIKSAVNGIKPTNQPTPQPNPSQPTPQPISKPGNTTQTVDVLGRYNPNNGGKVYRTARDAMNGTNGLNPYKPSYAGEQTFEAYNNLTGTRVSVQQGQSIDSVVQAVGASDPSQVSINVMNGNGDYLAWEPISEITEQVAQVAPKIH